MRLKTKIKKVLKMVISDSIESDPNYLAYQRMLTAGELEQYRGEYVAFRAGTLFGSSPDIGLLVNELNGVSANEGVYIHQVPRVGEN